MLPSICGRPFYIVEAGTSRRGRVLQKVSQVFSNMKILCTLGSTHRLSIQQNMSLEDDYGRIKINHFIIFFIRVGPNVRPVIRQEKAGYLARHAG